MWGLAVASGEVQLCGGPSSTPPSGAARIGYFPEEIQTYLVISIGISAATTEPNAARSFISLLVALPKAAVVSKAKGYEQMPAR
jgi:hypothetical protein